METLKEFLKYNADDDVYKLFDNKILFKCSLTKTFSDKLLPHFKNYTIVATFPNGSYNRQGYTLVLFYELY